MNVLIPTPLRSYTGGSSEVAAAGASLGMVLANLDAKYPGIRFRVVDEQDRIRPHIKFFVGQELAHSLDTTVDGGGTTFTSFAR